MLLAQFRRRSFRFSAMALVATSCCPNLFASPDYTEPSDPAPAEQQIVVVRGTRSEAASDEKAPPKVWLGVQLKELEGDLAAYLGEQVGVFVEAVYPESPAEKAGIKKGDVLTSADDRPIGTPKLLLDVLSERTGSDEKQPSLKLEVLRNGETLSVEANLVSRPELAKLKETEAIAGVEKELEELQFQLAVPKGEVEELMSQLGDEKFNVLNVLRLGGPAVVWDQDEVESTSNIDVKIITQQNDETMEVTVTKQGDEPATITCKRGDETEDHFGDDLSQLPPDVRKLVEPILKGKTSVRVLSGDAAEMKKLNLNEKAMEEFVVRVTEESAKARANAERIRASVRGSLARTADSTRSELESLRATVEVLKAELHELREQLKSQSDKN